MKLWLIRFLHWIGLTNLSDEQVGKFEGISKEQAMRLAETHPPPQSWYDEDMTGLY